jgi:hypothetical protein
MTSTTGLPDIVERLRRMADMTTTGNDLLDIGRAADEIERLRSNAEYWRLAAERRDMRKERSGLDIPEARTLDSPANPDIADLTRRLLAWPWESGDPIVAETSRKLIAETVEILNRWPVSPVGEREAMELADEFEGEAKGHLALGDKDEATKCLRAAYALRKLALSPSLTEGGERATMTSEQTASSISTQAGSK